MSNAELLQEAVALLSRWMLWHNNCAEELVDTRIFLNLIKNRPTEASHIKQQQDTISHLKDELRWWQEGCLG